MRHQTSWQIPKALVPTLLIEFLGGIKGPNPYTIKPVKVADNRIKCSATAMEACESKNETDTHPRAAPARVFGDVVCLGMACVGEFQRPKLPGKNKFGCSRELDQWEQSDIDALRLNQTALSNGTDPLSPGASEKDLEESADSGHAEAPIQGEGGLCCQYKEEEDRSCAAVAHKEQWRAVNGNTDGWKWPPPYDGWGYNIWY